MSPLCLAQLSYQYTFFLFPALPTLLSTLLLHSLLVCDLYAWYSRLFHVLVLTPQVPLLCLHMLMPFFVFSCVPIVTFDQFDGIIVVILLDNVDTAAALLQFRSEVDEICFCCCCCKWRWCDVVDVVVILLSLVAVMMKLLLVMLQRCLCWYYN